MTDGHFAALYDRLMADAPYNEWLGFAKSHFSPEAEIVDVACGTGTLTLMMAEEGYRVSGTDLSGDMLTVAEEKSRQKGLSVPFFLQDMRHLSGFSNLDGVTLFCDGINYLDSEDDVRQTFSRAASVLKQGGVFLFDAHTPYKMTHVFAGQLFGENSDDLAYMWFCEPGSEPLSVLHSFTFFVQTNSGLYERREEDHYQRTFEPSDYRAWLEEAGFSDIEITSDFGKNAPGQEDTRIFFKAVKK